MYRLAIVDDNPTWCFVLGLQLQQNGYAVSTFTEPHAFLREVNQFDLALIDFSIPNRRYELQTDGPDIICQIKQQFDHPPLLVLISSYFSDEILEQLSDLCPQADALLSKPIQSQDLLDQIERLLANRLCDRKTQQLSK